MSSVMEKVDLVVVGAGLYGITAAVTYHRLHPEASVLLLDSSPSIGGPWAQHRIFPGLKTNNLWGTYEIPDFPMDEARFGVNKGEHVPAERVADYLKSVVKEGGISDFVRLNSMVEIVDKADWGWKLHCVSTSPTDAGEKQTSTINTAKLILATGLVNRPSMPDYPTSADFAPKVIHSADLPAHFKDVVRPNTHTLIIGAGKSAWDIAYACSTAPSSTTTMLIRPSGDGPVWMSPPHVTPLGLWLEKLVFTRFFGYMSPCPWAESAGLEGWTRAFLHKTWLGRKIVGAFWGILGEDVVELNQLDKHPETKKLRPWRGAFEIGNALSILNYPTSFFDRVKDGRIKILIDEVERFDAGQSVTLRSGGNMEVDAVVCATGWQLSNNIEFRPSGIEKDLGLPTTSPPQDPEERLLVAKAESDILANFPYLTERDTSKTHHPDSSFRYTSNSERDAAQPYRLYRFLVPPSDLDRRSIGFAGALMSLGNASCAYLQALWLTSYFDRSIPLDTTSPAAMDKVRYETYQSTQYCKLRGAMGYGDKFPDLVFDSLPYFDVLLRDLGLKGKRKASAWAPWLWWKESFNSYGPEDYRGLLGELAGMQKTREGKKNV